MLQPHIVHLGINPPQKHHPLFFAKPPLNLQTVQAPYSRQFPPLYSFLANLFPTFPKNWIFQ